MTKTGLFVLALVLVTMSRGYAAEPQTAESTRSKPACARHLQMVNPGTMPKPVGTYSHLAVVKGGKTVYIAGQVALDATGKLVGKEDFRAQSEQVMKNLKAAVEAAGGDMSCLVKTNYYVVETAASELPAWREVRDRYIDKNNPPPATLIVVKRLGHTDFLIEADAVAVVGE